MADNVEAIGVNVTDANALSEKYLTFYIGNVIYGVNIDNVIEIIGNQAPTPVPGIPKFIRGIMNLRGHIVPVLDARLKLGVEEIEYDERSCIIVITWQDALVGLIVDCVAEVNDFNSEQLAPLPDFSSVNDNKYLSSICRVGDKLVQILDCEKFLADDSEAAVPVI